MTQTPKTVTCEVTTWLVSDAQDRELTAVEQAELRHHLGGCERCRGAARQFEVLFRQLGLLLGTATPNDDAR